MKIDRKGTGTEDIFSRSTRCWPCGVIDAWIPTLGEQGFGLESDCTAGVVMTTLEGKLARPDAGAWQVYRNFILAEVLD